MSFRSGLLCGTLVLGLAGCALAEDGGFSPMLDKVIDQAAVIVHVKVLTMNEADLKGVILEDDHVEHCACATVLGVWKGKPVEKTSILFWWQGSPPYPPRLRSGGEYLLFLKDAPSGEWRGADGKLHPVYTPVDPFVGIVPYDGLSAGCVRQRLTGSR